MKDVPLKAIDPEKLVRPVKGPQIQKYRGMRNNLMTVEVLGPVAVYIMQGGLAGLEGSDPLGM